MGAFFKLSRFLYIVFFFLRLTWAFFLLFCALFPEMTIAVESRRLSFLFFLLRLSCNEVSYIFCFFISSNGVKAFSCLFIGQNCFPELIN